MKAYFLKGILYILKKLLFASCKF